MSHSPWYRRIQTYTCRQAQESEINLTTSSTRPCPLAGFKLQLASLQLHLRIRYSRRRSSWSGVARKARTTHVHTTVASFSHSHSCSQANTLAFIRTSMHEDISVGVFWQGHTVTVQGGWTPPRHHAVLDDHLTKLYAAAESQLQGYVAALAEPPSLREKEKRRS